MAVAMHAPATPLTSVIVPLMAYEPAVVGVPETTPVLRKLKPGTGLGGL
jgi:hypothetical protein